MKGHLEASCHATSGECHANDAMGFKEEKVCQKFVIQTSLYADFKHI